jgi:hypothetical protein
MSSLDTVLLLRGVREIASHADAENPVQVSQRRWDQARRQSKRYTGLPLARDIARRLALPWREVLLLAHTPAEQHAHRLGRAQTRAQQDWLTNEHIAYVLRTVAARLNLRTLTPGQYRAERARMLAGIGRAGCTADAYGCPRMSRSGLRPAIGTARSRSPAWIVVLAVAIKGMAAAHSAP